MIMKCRCCGRKYDFSKEQFESLQDDWYCNGCMMPKKYLVPDDNDEDSAFSKFSYNEIASDMQRAKMIPEMKLDFEGLRTTIQDPSLFEILDNEKKQYDNLFNNVYPEISKDAEVAIDKIGIATVKYKKTVLKEYLDGIKCSAIKFQQNQKAKNEALKKSDIIDMDLANFDSQEYVPFRIENSIPQKLYVGEWRSQKNSFPAFVKFYKNSGIIIKVNKRTYDKGLAFLRAIVRRIYLTMPFNVKFTFIDSTGAAFPYAKDMKTTGAIASTDTDVPQILKSITSDMQRINKDMGLWEDNPLYKNVDKLRKMEKFEILAVANYPADFEPTNAVLKNFYNIIDKGYIAGKYAIVLYNADDSTGHMRDRIDPINEKCPNTMLFDLTKANINSGCTFVPLTDSISVPEWNNVVARLKENIAQKKEEANRTDLLKDSNTSKYWDLDSTQKIEAVIGKKSDDSDLTLWIGQNGNDSAFHGAVAGTTGSGKSVFFHSLIIGLSKRYSPSELRFYLIDGKHGATFKAYEDLPHCEAISVETTSASARAILAEVVGQIAKRNEFFNSLKTKYGVNIEQYSQYREFSKQRQSQGDEDFKKIIPRILLVIDEYKTLFEGEDATTALQDLSTLCSQGRNAGVHLMLGSQRFVEKGQISIASLYSNIHIRAALRMTLEDISSLSEIDKSERSTLQQFCNEAGKIYINERSGEAGGGNTGTVFCYNSNDILKFVECMSEYAKQEGYEIHKPIVLRKYQPEKISENIQLCNTLKIDKENIGAGIAALAKAQPVNGGYGIANWQRMRKPIISWIGRIVNLYDYASVVLQVAKKENIGIFGNTAYASYGILVSLVAGFAAGTQPNNLKFRIFDNTEAFEDDIIRDCLPKLCEDMKKCGIDCKYAKKKSQQEVMIRELAEEYHNRVNSDDVDYTRTIAIFASMDSGSAVRMKIENDDDGIDELTEFGKIFKTLYEKGSECGINVVLTAQSLIDSLIKSRRGWREFFNHIVCLQMRDDELSTLMTVQNKAYKFSEDELFALKNNDIAFYKCDNRIVQFKPYAIRENLAGQFNEVITKLSERNAK